MPTVDLTAPELTTLILGAQLVVLFAAALFAGWQVREIRRTRQDESRPFVVADFEVKKGMIYLVITNTGRTMARDVRFAFDPALSGTLDDRNRAEPWSLATLKMFRDGIPALPPGKRIVTLFDSSFQRNRDVYPDEYEVTVDYADAAGKRRFSGERIVLDLGIYWGLLRVEEKDADDIHKSLNELVREVKRWSASGGGLLVLTPSEVKQRWERWEETREPRTDAA